MSNTYGKNQKGVTMLLALIIMSAVVAVALGLSILILNRFVAASNIDQAITAFYGAETGIEKHLKTAKDNRNDPNETLSSTITAITTPPDNQGTLTESKATWNTQGSRSDEDFLLTHIKQNETKEFDLFDPIAPAATSGVESIKLEWSDHCSGSSMIKVSAVRWNFNAGNIQFDPRGYEYLYACGNLTGSPCVDKTVNSIDASNLGASSPSVEGSYNYRIKITSIYCDIRFLRITAYSQDNLGGAKVPFKNRLFIKSIGRSVNSGVALFASMPWELPAQGIFDYVIFSEESLEKKY